AVPVPRPVTARTRRGEGRPAPPCPAGRSAPGVQSRTDSAERRSAAAQGPAGRPHRSPGRRSPGGPPGSGNRRDPAAARLPAGGASRLPASSAAGSRAAAATQVAAVAPKTAQAPRGLARSLQTDTSKEQGGTLWWLVTGWRWAGTVYDARLLTHVAGRASSGTGHAARQATSRARFDQCPVDSSFAFGSSTPERRWARPVHRRVIALSAAARRPWPPVPV